MGGEWGSGLYKAQRKALEKYGTRRESLSPFKLMGIKPQILKLSDATVIHRDKPQRPCSSSSTPGNPKTSEEYGAMYHLSTISLCNGILSYLTPSKTKT